MGRRLIWCWVRSAAGWSGRGGCVWWLRWGRLDIAVIGHVATDQARRAGTLFFKPGGPGTSGTAALPLAYGLFPAQVLAQFDIVLDVGRPRPFCQTVRGGRNLSFPSCLPAAAYRQGWRGPVRLVFGK